MLRIVLWSPIILNGQLIPYWVSTDGRVKNRFGDILYTRIHNGYMDTSLYVNGKNAHPRIHRLVAEAFIPNPDNLPQVNHIDGNKLNNYVSNLEWVTRKQNMRHAWDNGLHEPMYGQDNPSTKHSDEAIDLTCQLLEEGKLTYKEIERITGVPPSVCNHIVHKEIWLDISNNYDIKPRNIRHIQNIDVAKVDQLLLKGYKPKQIMAHIHVCGMTPEQFRQSIKSRRRTLQRNGLL